MVPVSFAANEFAVRRPVPRGHVAGADRWGSIGGQRARGDLDPDGIEDAALDVLREALGGELVLERVGKYPELIPAILEAFAGFGGHRQRYLLLPGHSF